MPKTVSDWMKRDHVGVPYLLKTWLITIRAVHVPRTPAVLFSRCDSILKLWKQSQYGNNRLTLNLYMVLCMTATMAMPKTIHYSVVDATLPLVLERTVVDKTHMMRRDCQRTQ